MNILFNVSTESILLFADALVENQLENEIIGVDDNFITIRVDCKNTDMEIIESLKEIAE